MNYFPYLKRNMNKIKALKIIDYLEKLYPTYHNFLNYSNNYELLLAVSLSAQTTDKSVNNVTPLLFDKYKSPLELANANYDDVYQIIKQLGLAKTKAKNIIALAKTLNDKFNGIVPNTNKELETLPGVGRKTANVVMALGFNIPAFPVDTHVNRLAIRLGFTKEEDNILKVEEKLKKYIPKERWIKAHHQFILFGRNICQARNPKCELCELKELCKYEGRRKNS